MVLPLNNGAEPEAIETSVKLARKGAHEKKGEAPEGKATVLGVSDNFRGRMLGITWYVGSVPEGSLAKRPCGPFNL